MKLSLIIPLTALALLVGCAKSPLPAAKSVAPEAKPIAIVNGTPISRPLFDYFVKFAASKSAAELTPEQRNQVLDTLILAVLAGQEAQKQGLDKTGDTPYQLEINRMQILQETVAENYLKDKKPTDAELQAEYDAEVSQVPKQYHPRDILVPSQEQATQIISQLHQGAKFEDLVKKYSQDAASKTHGGDLGWISLSSLTGERLRPFADALVRLNKGEISPPVQSPDGWHVIQVIDTRASPVPPLEQVKDQIAQSEMRKKFRTYEEGLLKTAKVERNP